MKRGENDLLASLWSQAGWGTSEEPSLANWSPRGGGWECWICPIIATLNHSFKFLKPSHLLQTLHRQPTLKGFNILRVMWGMWPIWGGCLPRVMTSSQGLFISGDSLRRPNVNSHLNSVRMWISAGLKTSWISWKRRLAGVGGGLLGHRHGYFTRHLMRFASPSLLLEELERACQKGIELWEASIASKRLCVDHLEGWTTVAGKMHR